MSPLQFRNYRSIAEFFARSLKEDARTIDTNSCLVSPADGRVLHFGLATHEQVEQVRIVVIIAREIKFL